MKCLFNALLVLGSHTAAAQNSPPSAPPLIQYPVKGYVLLQNNEKVVIRGISYSDSSTVLLYSPGSNVLNGSYTFKDDIRTMKMRTAPIAAIKVVRAQRQSFLKGATVGALIGFGLGALVGYLAHEEKFSYDREEESDSRKAAAFKGGIIGAVPAGILGGMSGGVFIKKKFYINGQREALEKTLRRVSH